MRVKCLCIIDPVTKESMARRAGLRIGSIYQVLSLSTTNSSEVCYQILDSENDASIHHASQFEIVDTRLPRNWIPYHNAERGYFELSPAPWTPLGFWEAYFDDEPWALEIFAQEKAIIDELEETSAI